uniref:Kinesin-like protein n=1 Tax=Hirondellea gigas TaxID=1518452 RepID=A0A2P2IG01_9CRUS
MARSANVKVALRVRPLLLSELGQTNIIQYSSPTQVCLGNRKSFSYDFIFTESSKQSEVYNESVFPLVTAFVEGYNATVLAYGQTGSGKTYTMGTAAGDATMLKDDFGVIPNVVKRLFDLTQKESDVEYKVRVNFCEIYLGSIKDLLCPTRDNNNLQIRGVQKTGVRVAGLTDVDVCSYDEIMAQLELGTLHRATGSTRMNTKSSRSHAIFTIILTQSRKTKGFDVYDDSKDGKEALEQEIRTSKFNFVDLAGSEGLKQTQTVGKRKREAIENNGGLFVLGNVISVLGDPSKKGEYVPFRDSKLTRLLEDSLGGNSKTLMIACVSPASDNFKQTLDCMEYANRARNIKNRPVINRDPQSQEMDKLRKRVKQLETALSRTAGGDISELLKASSQDSNEIDSNIRQINAHLESENRKNIEDLNLSLQKQKKLEEKIREIEEKHETEIEALSSNLISANNQETMNCQQCGYRVVNESALRQHIRRVHGEKKFHCRFHGCSSKYKSTIEQNRNRHEKIHIFSCPNDQCSETFSKKCNYPKFSAHIQNCRSNL